MEVIEKQNSRAVEAIENVALDPRSEVKVHIHAKTFVAIAVGVHRLAHTIPPLTYFFYRPCAQSFSLN
jgi:hypothetical protein